MRGAHARADSRERMRTWRLRGPLDLIATLGPLRHGTGDPTIELSPRELWRATRTAEGPATLHLTLDGASMIGRAWGAGADRALEGALALVGEHDQPAALDQGHPVVRELARRRPGLRFGRTDRVLEALVPAIVEQKVTGIEARRSYRALIRGYGEPAPGPLVRRAGGSLRPLMVPPAPEVLARLPTWAYHPLGVEGRRGETIRRAASLACRLEESSAMPRTAARARMESVPGVGRWTAAEAARTAFGDADAVSVGDFHTPHLVSWLLAGEPRGTDARMLELLEPYRGQRARVVRLLELSGHRPPAYGPRMAPRWIGGI